MLMNMRLICKIYKHRIDSPLHFNNKKDSWRDYQLSFSYI